MLNSKSIKPPLKEIEKFFLSTLLRVYIGGLFFVLVTDILLYPEDLFSIQIDTLILGSCVVSYLIRKRYPMLAIITICTIVLIAMIYRTYVHTQDINTTLCIILMVGFTISVMLKNMVWLVSQIITGMVIVSIIWIEYSNPNNSYEGLINFSITYGVLYFILVFATASLKRQYDLLHENLEKANIELHNRASEINAQNEELIQIQEHLSELNKDLELKVNERTERLKTKTEKLQVYNDKILKYSYSNAHHLRGPVARLLGLISVSKLNTDLGYPFIFNRIEDQAKEIDDVVKQINSELEIPDFLAGNQ